MSMTTRAHGLRWLSAAALLVPIALLVVLVVDVAIAGIGRLDLELVLNSGLQRSVGLVALTAALALPVGVGAAIYLEEYGLKVSGLKASGLKVSGHGLGKLAAINIAQLEAVPSVIYGLLAVELFARRSSAGGSLIAGAVALALVVSPMIITGTRQALRSVSPSQREAALALGGTRLQMLRHVVLPIAAPGIMSAAILAVARALGEAAPLLVLGGLLFGGQSPGGLPVQIFEWIGAAQPLEGEAAAAILVLLAVVLGLNGVAMIVRDRAARQIYAARGTELDQ